MTKFKLTIYGVLITVLLLGLIQILSKLNGLALRLELAGFFTLLLFIILGFVGYANKWGESFFFFSFVFYLANLVLLWYYSGLFYFVLLIITLFGFIMSIPKKRHSTQPVAQMEPPEPLKEEPQKPETTFSPGKYVASSRSNTFHEPKCEWAKKIKAEKIWFADQQEAEDKKYKKHNCV